jgi:hypothetical protein
LLLTECEEARHVRSVVSVSLRLEGGLEEGEGPCS